MSANTGMWKSIALLLSVLASAFSQECQVYEEIPSTGYARNYSTITDGVDGFRPLGYLRSTYVYQSGEKPCFSISGERLQNIEIKFETSPPTMLCVREKQTDYVRCAHGRFSHCRPLTDTQMDYEFFCDVSRGCGEGLDVSFWVRFTKGPKPEDDTEGMWCHELVDEYPESLRPLPANFLPPGERNRQIHDYTIGGSTRTYACSNVIVVMLVFILGCL